MLRKKFAIIIILGLAFTVLSGFVVIDYNISCGLLAEAGRVCVEELEGGLPFPYIKYTGEDPCQIACDILVLPVLEDTSIIAYTLQGFKVANFLLDVIVFSLIAAPGVILYYYKDRIKNSLTILTKRNIMEDR